MQGYVLHGIGDIRLEKLEKPKPEKGMVLVKVMAAGICGSDIPRIYQTGAHRMPLIPGHEFSGRVEALGECVSETWLGKRVGIFPLMPCGTCPQCLKKQYEMCQHYNYLGSRTDGGFAEYVAVPLWNLLELPEEVTYRQAAMLEPASVAMHAVRGLFDKELKDGNIMQVGNSGELSKYSVAVCGLGTIGLLVVMVLKGFGFSEIYVLGNKEAQRKMAEKLGISGEDYCDTKMQDPQQWLMEKTKGQGVNAFFECVGKNEVVKLSLLTTAPKGRVMLLGNPASDMNLDRDTYWKILRKQLTLKGTWNSSYQGEEKDDWHLVLGAIREGRLHPEDLITHLLAFDRLHQGLEVMRDKTEDYVKVMIQAENKESEG